MKAGYIAPQFFTRTNLFVAGSQVAVMQGTWALKERMKADADGPGYAFGPNGTVGAGILNSNAIFGPWGNIRGYEPERQNPKDGAGEITAIMDGWQDIDPGEAKTDAVSAETKKAPIMTTKGDFDDASDLGNKKP